MLPQPNAAQNEKNTSRQARAGRMRSTGDKTAHGACKWVSKPSGEAYKYQLRAYHHPAIVTAPAKNARKLLPRSFRDPDVPGHRVPERRACHTQRKLNTKGKAKTRLLALLRIADPKANPVSRPLRADGPRLIKVATPHRVSAPEAEANISLDTSTLMKMTWGVRAIR